MSPDKCNNRASGYDAGSDHLDAPLQTADSFDRP
jgi:hypothetical protein